MTLDAFICLITLPWVKILIVDKFLSDKLINLATYYVNYGITLLDWESTINK